ncbi:MAG: hypothetical protein IJ769_10275 [Clostridia bacterium]|nr:hypothetical protein [Clostridia bacterium]
MKKKISVGFILAAALLALSAAAIAATKLNLFSGMTNSVRPIVPLESAEKLIETNLGRMENEWATMTVEQAAYDGQGVNVLARIRPKEPEAYALFNSWMMDFPEDEYDVYWGPDEVPSGTQESNIIEGGVKIVNEGGVQAYYEAGEEIPIPEGREAAMAASCLVFRENGKLYYTYQDAIRVTGRKDGKRIVGFDVDLRAVSDDPALDDLFLSMGSEAQEQSDGSLLVWLDGIAEQPLPEEVELKLTFRVWPNGEEDWSDEVLDELTFTLTKGEDERVARYVPENSGAIDDHVRVREVNIRYTAVRAYFTIDYDYEAREDELMGIHFYPYDAEGNLIHTSGGWTTDSAERGDFSSEDVEKLGFWRQQGEMQSFDEIPDAIVLEANVVDGELLGQCVCRRVDAE